MILSYRHASYYAKVKEDLENQRMDNTRTFAVPKSLI